MLFNRMEVGGHQHGAASGLTDPNDGYASRLGRMLGITAVVNRAAANAQYSGLTGGVVSIAQQAWNALPRAQRGAPFLSGSGLVILDGGRSDAVAYGQPTAAQAAAFRHGLRATICRYRACAVYNANDGGLTFSGSWAAAAADAEWSGGFTKAVGANADYFELTVPSGWPGGFGFIVCPQTANSQGAVFTIAVDGVTAGTLDTREVANTGTLCPATKRFVIAAGASTVRVTAGNLATAARFNHIGLEAPSGATGHAVATPYFSGACSPPLVVVAQDPRPFSYGATGLDDGSYPPLTAENVLTVAQEFASNMVVAADLDGSLFKATQYFQGTDTLAPSVLGHVRIAATLAHAISAAGVGTADYAMLASAVRQILLRMGSSQNENPLSILHNNGANIFTVDSNGSLDSAGVLKAALYLQSLGPAYVDGGNINIRQNGAGVSFDSPDGSVTKVLTIDNSGNPVWT